MVGLVIVSHSPAIAAGIADLVGQMTQGKVALAVAGGIDDPDNPLGTDAMKVFEAITEVYSADGVVVLIDLGSALMSAETALEFLDPDQRANVHLCPAALVEGAVAAGVQASIGATVEQVIQEALDAYAAKQSQFPDAAPAPAAAPTPADERGGPTETLTVTIPNRLGLHARPAARFVAITNRHDATVTLRKDDKTIDARSINQVVTLGAHQGDTIEIRASGQDASAVLTELQALIDDNLGDDDDATAQPAAQPKTTGAVGASPGIAIGPAVLLRRSLPTIEATTIDDPDAAWAHLQTVLTMVSEEMQQTIATMPKSEAEIFEAHLLILQDPELLDAVQAKITEERLNAGAAWQQTIGEIAARYRAVEDDYIRERADDVQDVGRRVLARLTDIDTEPVRFESPGVLVTDTLFPSDVAALSPEMTLGIITASGGTTSHSAIIARSLGIPAVVGGGAQVNAIAHRQTVGLNGKTGELWVEPSEAEADRLRQAAQTWRDERQRLQAAAHETAVTQDGHRVIVAANIGSVSDARLAVKSGAEGVGLFRSELLFMERDSAPTEDEQVSIYREVGTIMGERPVIVRTLDIGGDKPLPYLDAPEEENPFLGLRGVRYTLAHTPLFKTQLRALLRAAADANLSVMFPMISTLSELHAARALLDEVRDELRAEGVEHAETMPVGMMIEVPAAVLIAGHLARKVDFFSIGTNDLTQYLMAADRGNAAVGDLVDALHPAVLHMVQQTVNAAHDAGIEAYMCGELAGDPLATPLLVGLGLDELSMGAAAIPAVKARLRTLTLPEAQAIVDGALSQPSAAAVQTYLEGLA
jgi:multiphosphoryl transfer protein